MRIDGSRTCESQRQEASPAAVPSAWGGHRGSRRLRIEGRRGPAWSRGSDDLAPASSCGVHRGLRSRWPPRRRSAVAGRDLSRGNGNRPTAACCSRVAGDRHGQRRRGRVRDGADRASPRGNRFEEARTRQVYGEFLRRRKRRAEAREQLGAAAATFDSLEPPPGVIGRLQSCDWPASERPPVAPSGRAGPEALTRQEGEVAELVRGGLSNREIANRLVLSVKTVEGHLTTIYGKFGVASRTQLVAALARTWRSSSGAHGPLRSLPILRAHARAGVLDRRARGTRHPG